jgi:hypothetical protein
MIGTWEQDLPKAGSTGAPVASYRAVAWRRRNGASGDLAWGAVVATGVRISAGGRRKAGGVGMGGLEAGMGMGRLGAAAGGTELLPTVSRADLGVRENVSAEQENASAKQAIWRSMASLLCDCRKLSGTKPPKRSTPLRLYAVFLLPNPGGPRQPKSSVPASYPNNVFQLFNFICGTCPVHETTVSLYS